MNLREKWYIVLKIDMHSKLKLSNIINKLLGNPYHFDSKLFYIQFISIIPLVCLNCLQHDEYCFYIFVIKFSIFLCDKTTKINVQMFVFGAD